MSNETTIKDQAKGINWHTAIFIALFHVGAAAALFMFTGGSDRALVDYREPGRRDGLSPAVDTPQLQDAKDSGILSDPLRRTRA